MPKLLTVGTNGGRSSVIGKQSSVNPGKLEPEIVVSPAEKSPKEEMRELLVKVKPTALRERMLKVWAKL